LIAQWLGAEPVFIMLAGLFAMAAHQWSPFLKFQGGLGATTTGGILISIATVPTLIGAIIAILILIKTKKSTWAFAAGILVIAVVLFAMQWSNVPPPSIMIAAPSLPPPLTQYQLVIAYPIILGLSQIIKVCQIKHCPGSPLNVK
jgi:glycerol-3-phosphate acyltransferase PlsY